METNKNPKKIPLHFCCMHCDYSTSSVKDYDKHLTTSKHKRLIKTNENCKKILNNKGTHICDCGKNYKHMSSLCKHKKSCQVIFNPTQSQINKEITPELIIEIIKQNSEFKQLIMDQNKTIIELANKAGSNNNTINSNNNKTFNLQVFLNETCKDAINLTDFIDSIKVQIKDLERVSEKGYAEGVSQIFINNLQQLNTHSRPIHCSDSKRETLYIKDEDQWSKDDENKTVLTKAIKQVANKNIKQISEWQKLHPEYSDPESKQNDKYMKIVLNSMSGSTKEESNKNYEKIVKNVIKETIIEK